MELENGIVKQVLLRDDLKQMRLKDSQQSRNDSVNVEVICVVSECLIQLCFKTFSIRRIENEKERKCMVNCFWGSVCCADFSINLSLDNRSEGCLCGTQFVFKRMLKKLAATMCWRLWSNSGKLQHMQLCR
jgi:hypothetical protein